MATKTKTTKPKPAAKPAPAPQAPPPVAPEELASELRNLIDRLDGDDDVNALVEKLESLRQQVLETELALNAKLARLRAIERMLQQPTAPTKTPTLDEGLLQAIADLNLTQRRFDGPDNKTYDAPTGARPWVDLIAAGATDAAIEKNLRHVADHHGAAYRIRKYGELTLERRAGAFNYVPILKNRPVVDAVRRLLQIPLPAGAAAPKPAPSAAMKKPAKAKPAKKPAAGKKPARKYASGAEKRRRKEARVAAAAAKADAEKNGPAAVSAPEAEALARPAGDPLKMRELRPGDDDGKSCEVCGCTNFSACDGPCYWTETGDPQRWLCSACAADVPAKPAKPPKTPGAVNSDDVPAKFQKAKRVRGRKSPLLTGARTQ